MYMPWFSMLAASLLICLCASANAQPTPFVRLAELDIDAAQLEAFKVAANEHIEATIRDESGVLAFHAVAEKDTPTRIRVFEMYADANAYRAHLETPHFQKFRTATDKMVTGRKVFDTVPILLGAKTQLRPRPLVRLAELEIDPGQLVAYKTAVTEEIEASIRVEPGVLAIYSVALKDYPTQLRFFEIYADEGAYRQHIESPHFKQYVDATKFMIKARRLLETQPIALAIKPR